MSAFAEVGALTAQRIWAGVVGRAVHGERLTVAVVELDAMSTVPQHRHANEQVGVCLTGSLYFRVGDERRDLGPGGIWCIPAQTPHEVVAGPDGAVVIEAFAPARDDWRELEHVRAAPRWPK